MNARYFKSAREFGEWLEEHHATATELLVGFYKKGTSRPTLSWPESVDEALCHGWIDGIRRRVDDDRYTIRFTPRRSGSYWSAVNTKRAQIDAASFGDLSDVFEGATILARVAVDDGQLAGAYEIIVLPDDTTFGS